MELKQYWFWLIPEKKICDEFRKIITELSSKYNTSSFEPHVTLLTGITLSEDEVIKRAKQLADKLKPFKVSLDFVDFDNALLSAIVCWLQQNKGLENLHKEAAELFEIKEAREYRPHISLMYGDFPEIAINDVNLKLSETNKTFIIDSICIASTKGGIKDVKDWYEIARIPLKLN